MSKRKAPAPPRVRRPREEVDPPGPGPWWAFMMVDVDPRGDTKKTTEVRLDTYPELIKAIKNRAGQGEWVIVMRMGPFYELDFALSVFNEWSDATRGPGPRIAQGICLFKRYGGRGIELWVIEQTKKEVQALFETREVRDGGSGGAREPGRTTAREALAACGGARGRKRGRR